MFIAIGDEYQARIFDRTDEAREHAETWTGPQVRNGELSGRRRWLQFSERRGAFALPLPSHSQSLVPLALSRVVASLGNEERERERGKARQGHTYICLRPHAVTSSPATKKVNTHWEFNQVVKKLMGH